MDIDVRTLACWLENAWDDAPASANTLRVQLRNMERNAANLFSAGSIGSVSKNSASQSYAGAGFGRFSVAQIQQGYRMLIELYDADLAETAIIYKYSQQYPTNQRSIDFNTAFPDYSTDPDKAVYAFMKYDIQPVDNYQIDLTDLRLHPTLVAGTGVNTW